MSEQEAIEVIKKADEQSVKAIEELKSIEDKAIALDKYGEYYSVLQNCLKEREACALAIKALEKQIPIKTNIKVHDKDTKIGSIIFALGTKVHYCPQCNMPVTGSNNYCGNCGQALIW